MGYNFSQKIQETDKQYGSGSGDFYQFEKGPNKVRVLAFSEKPVAKHFVSKKYVNCIGEKDGCQYHGDGAPKNDKGEPTKPTVQYLAYVLDRKDNTVKIMFMPYGKIYKKIAELACDIEWGFDDLPMPYDITINYDPDAAPADKYSMVPSPTKTVVPKEFMDKIKSMTSLDEIRDKILNKQAGHERKIVTPSGKTVNDEDIPVIEEDEEKVTEKDLPF